MATDPADIRPLPDDVAAELKRLVERWRQLPLDQALSYAAPLRAEAGELFERVARAHGRLTGPVEVPDLGPATALDQLMVAAFDVVQLGGDHDVVRQVLARVRSSIAAPATRHTGGGAGR